MPAQIEAEVKRVLKSVAPGGGLMLGSSAEIHDAIPLENALALYRSAKKWGKYPIRIDE